MGAILGWIALGLIVGAGALWWRRAMAVSLPRNRTGFVLVWAAGALLGVVALTQGGGWAAGVPAGLAAVVGGFLLLLVAISPQKVGPDAIAVGEALRDFDAPDENGEIFRLATTRGRPLLLKFFRGHW